MPTTTVTRRFRKKRTRAQHFRKTRCTFTRRTMAMGGKTRSRNRAKLLSPRTVRQRRTKTRSCRYHKDGGIICGVYGVNSSKSKSWAKRLYPTMKHRTKMEGTFTKGNGRSCVYEYYPDAGLLFYWKHTDESLKSAENVMGCRYLPQMHTEPEGGCTLIPNGIQNSAHLFKSAKSSAVDKLTLKETDETFTAALTYAQRKQTTQEIGKKILGIVTRLNAHEFDFFSASLQSHVDSLIEALLQDNSARADPIPSNEMNAQTVQVSVPSTLEEDHHPPSGTYTLVGNYEHKPVWHLQKNGNYSYIHYNKGNHLCIDVLEKNRSWDELCQLWKNVLDTTPSVPYDERSLCRIETKWQKGEYCGVNGQEDWGEFKWTDISEDILLTFE